MGVSEKSRLEMMWKEIAMAWFEVLSQHLRGGLRKVTKISGRIVDVPAEIRISGALPLDPTYLAVECSEFFLTLNASSRLKCMQQAVRIIV
jgi:hypothetical protein